MYGVLVKLIVGAALLQAGLAFTQDRDFSGHGCLSGLRHASKQVLNINWKPISIFPVEVDRSH